MTHEWRGSVISHVMTQPLFFSQVRSFRLPETDHGQDRCGRDETSLELALQRGSLRFDMPPHMAYIRLMANLVHLVCASTAVQPLMAGLSSRLLKTMSAEGICQLAADS